MLGLANLLRRYSVTYEQFGRALESFNSGNTIRTAAYELVSRLASGIDQVASIARQNNMVRAFAIASTASCSYRSRDLDGYTCTPEIAIHPSHGLLTVTLAPLVSKLMIMET